MFMSLTSNELHTSTFFVPVTCFVHQPVYISVYNRLLMTQWIELHFFKAENPCFATDKNECNLTNQNNFTTPPCKYTHPSVILYHILLSPINSTTNLLINLPALYIFTKSKLRQFQVAYSSLRHVQNKESCLINIISSIFPKKVNLIMWKIAQKGGLSRKKSPLCLTKRL